MESSFAIDHDNLQELVGYADNVFVGYVENLENTVYKFPVSIETKNGVREVTQPYTTFSVTVTENIKGSLLKTHPISLQKAGGIDEENNLLLLYEDDFLPEEGQYYLFSTFTQPDGSLLISGPNTNRVLDIEEEDQIYGSALFRDSTEAVSNEVRFNRERFISDYEE